MLFKIRKNTLKSTNPEVKIIGIVIASVQLYEVLGVIINKKNVH